MRWLLCPSTSTWMLEVPFCETDEAKGRGKSALAHLASPTLKRQNYTLVTSPRSSRAASVGPAWRSSRSARHRHSATASSESAMCTAASQSLIVDCTLPKVPREPHTHTTTDSSHPPAKNSHAAHPYVSARKNSARSNRGARTTLALGSCTLSAFQCSLSSWQYS